MQVTLATAPGRSAVASVIVTGHAATATVARLFRPASGKPLEAAAINQIVFGRWLNESPLGEELVVCRRSCDRVEIHCHGGHAASAAIIESLVDQGCQQTAWQDWVQQNESDAIAAEARIDLAGALTARAAAVLLDQYRGVLQSAFTELAASTASGDLSRAEGLAAELLRYAPIGMHLTTPWRVVVTGRANVGKSSLINAILGYQRSIVYNRPGTTRDIVTAHTAMDGWPVQLADTPGLRTSQDKIEQAGVAMAYEQLAAADCVILVCDATQSWTWDDEQLLKRISPAMVVYNKSDLPGNEDLRPSGLWVSAKTSHGVDQLVRQIADYLVPQVPPVGAAVPFRSRHVEAIESRLKRPGAC